MQLKTAQVIKYRIWTNIRAILHLYYLVEMNLRNKYTLNSFCVNVIELVFFDQLLKFRLIDIAFVIWDRWIKIWNKILRFFFSNVIFFFSLNKIFRLWRSTTNSNKNKLVWFCDCVQCCFFNYLIIIVFNYGQMGGAQRWHIRSSSDGSGKWAGKLSIILRWISLESTVQYITLRGDSFLYM